MNIQSIGKHNNEVIMCDKIQAINIGMIIDDTCVDCRYYDGEECNGENEGSVMYDDSPACDGFDEIEYEER